MAQRVSWAKNVARECLRNARYYKKLKESNVQLYRSY